MLIFTYSRVINVTGDIMQKCMKYIIIAIGVFLVLNAIYRKTRFYYNDPIFRPFSTRLNTETLMLQVGESYQLRPQALNKRVSYGSSNIRVVDVLPNGKIKAKAIGTAIINAKMKQGTAQCKVTVIDISDHKLTLSVGEKEKLSVKGTKKSVSWKCSSKIAEVDDKGQVTALKTGRATITAKVGGKCLECNLYIEK